MSGGGRPSSFGRKGFSTQQKKEKKKKQDFHKHKLKSAEEETQVNFQELKTRVSTALDKLGHQVFSLELGGYTFQNWMTSFSLLLDDFEAKAGSNLPASYSETRQRLTSELLEVIDTSPIDSQISTVEAEIEFVEEKASQIAARAEEEASREKAERASKLSSLKKEKTASEAEVSNAKLALEVEKERSANTSFFRKLFSGKSAGGQSSPKAAQSRYESAKTNNLKLDDEVKSLEREIDENSSSPAALTRASEQSTSLRSQLDSLRNELAELEAKKLEQLQLKEKREIAAKTLSALIMSLPDKEVSADSSSKVSETESLPSQERSTV